MGNIPIAKQLNQADKYSWMRDPNWPKVNNQEILDYLEQENNYFKDKTSTNKDLEKELYAELKNRIKEEDETYPVTIDNLLFFSRMEAKKDYPIFCMKEKNSNTEEVILDFNLLAKNYPSFALGDTSKDSSLSKFAYSFDGDGSERFKIKVRDLKTKQDYPDVIENTHGEIVWNKAGTGFFYAKLNDNWRPTKIFFHELGKNETDLLVYEEKEDTFYMGISHSSDEKYLIINSSNGSQNEIRLIELDDKSFEINLVFAKSSNHLYEIDHADSKFFILTNDKGNNFRLAYINDGEKFLKENLKEIIPHSANKYLIDFSANSEYFVITKKYLGLNCFEYFSLKDLKYIDTIDFDEEIYDAHCYFTHKDDSFLRVIYSSLISPKTIFEYNFKTKELQPRKIDEVPNYNKNNYECTRVWAEAEDGIKVPISIVKRKDVNYPSKLLLYGYGSYGYAINLSFRSNIVSLLDRGFIYAIAHIRGGDELGFDWYESAKFLTKKLTFSDFISCAKYLLAQKYTNQNRLNIMGGSAGGMLMGVVVNQAPELFNTAIALVPFVDVLNTMLDESLPLTPHEFEEWGNPKETQYFEYIKSYCPYQNIKAQNYPKILATAGLTDPRVGYWEAAKWVAKLREFKSDNNDIILKVDMDAGHKGKSGRYESLEEVAMIYSYLIKNNP